MIRKCEFCDNPATHYTGDVLEDRPPEYRTKPLFVCVEHYKEYVYGAPEPRITIVEGGKL